MTRLLAALRRVHARPAATPAPAPAPAARPATRRFFYVLPGTGIYGGVKKGFHCADLLGASGYPCTVATPDGSRPAWFESSCAVTTRDELRATCRSADVVLFSCPADAPFVDALPAQRKIVHMQGANTPADHALMAPRRGYEFVSHGLHMTYELQLRGRVAPYVAMGVPEVFRWRGEPKAPGSVAAMPRKGDAILRDVRRAAPEADFVLIDGLTERETAECLRGAEIFLAVSAGEALGLPPLEAMCAGCCVVGFPGVGGFEFMRHRETAHVVPNGDVDALAAGLRLVLADGSYRESLRRGAAAVCAYYTMERERVYLLRALELEDRAGTPGATP